MKPSRKRPKAVTYTDPHALQRYAANAALQDDLRKLAKNPRLDWKEQTSAAEQAQGRRIKIATAPKRGGKKSGTTRLSSEAMKLKRVVSAFKKANFRVPSSGHWKAEALDVLKRAGVRGITKSFLTSHRAALRIRSVRSPSNV